MKSFFLWRFYPFQWTVCLYDSLNPFFTLCWSLNFFHDALQHAFCTFFSLIQIFFIKHKKENKRIFFNETKLLNKQKKFAFGEPFFLNALIVCWLFLLFSHFLLYQSSKEIKIKAARDATYSLDSSTLNETFFLAVCDSFAWCLLFLLFAALFISCRLSVGGRFTNTRTLEGTKRFTACNLFLLLSISFSPLNFRFLIFLFICLCVFHPPTRCYWCYVQCRSKPSVLYFRYACLFSLFPFRFFCIFWN